MGLDAEFIQKVIKATVFTHVSRALMMLLAAAFLIQGGMSMVRLVA